MTILLMLAGVALFAGASLFFWQIGREGTAGDRWRTFPGMEMIAVAIVLGGWSAGACCVVYSVVFLFT